MATRKKKSEGFIDKLKNKVTEAKVTGEALGKVAIEKGKEGIVSGSEIGKKMTESGAASIEKRIASAKKSPKTSHEMIELIEKLGNLKDSGLITEKEFQSKKREILDKI